MGRNGHGGLSEEASMKGCAGEIYVMKYHLEIIFM